jgi:hypothetical protein
MRGMRGGRGYEGDVRGVGDLAIWFLLLRIWSSEVGAGRIVCALLGLSSFEYL